MGFNKWSGGKLGARPFRNLSQAASLKPPSAVLEACRSTTESYMENTRLFSIALCAPQEMLENPTTCARATGNYGEHTFVLHSPPCPSPTLSIRDSCIGNRGQTERRIWQSRLTMKNIQGLIVDTLALGKAACERQTSRCLAESSDVGSRVQQDDLCL